METTSNPPDQIVAGMEKEGVGSAMSKQGCLNGLGSSSGKSDLISNSNSRNLLLDSRLISATGSIRGSKSPMFVSKNKLAQNVFNEFPNTSFIPPAGMTIVNGFPQLCGDNSDQKSLDIDAQEEFPTLPQRNKPIHGLREAALPTIGNPSHVDENVCDTVLGAAAAVVGSSLLPVEHANMKGTNEHVLPAPKQNMFKKWNKKVRGKSTEDKHTNAKPWTSLFKDNRTPLLCSELYEFSPQSKVGTTGSCDLNEDDLLPLEKAWGHSLIGYFAGNFPGLWSINNMTKGWGVPVEHHSHRSGWMVFKFQTEKDMSVVLENGPYFAAQQPLILKPVPELFRYEDEEMKLMPVWISLPRLPKECWGVNSLSKIVSQVGKPLRMDKRTSTLDAFSYARALVIVDASEELITKVKVSISKKATFTQDITYDYMPEYCTLCKCIGHMKAKCRKNDVVNLDPASVDEVHTLHVPNEMGSNPVDTVQNPKVVQVSCGTVSGQKGLDCVVEDSPGNSGQKGVDCAEKVVKEKIGNVHSEEVEVHTDSSDSDYEASEASETTEPSEASEDREGSHEHQEEAKSNREECLESDKASQGMESGISEMCTEKETVQVSDTVTYDVNKLGVVSVTHSTVVNNQENDIEQPVGSTKIVDGIEYELIEVESEPEPRYQTRNRSGKHYPYRSNRGGRSRGSRGRGGSVGGRDGNFYYHTPH